MLPRRSGAYWRHVSMLQFHIGVFALKWIFIIFTVQIIANHFPFYRLAYHWDTSDWMPSPRLSDIEEVPGYEASHGNEVAGSTPCLSESTRELESDYYLGGYDIDSDYLPPHEEEFLNQDQLPPPLPTGEDYTEPYAPFSTNTPLSKESTLSTRHQHARPYFHPSQYLPPHQIPTGEAPNEVFSSSVSGRTPGNGDTDDSVSRSIRLSVGASSASDMSTPCGLDDSEHGSDFDSMDELHRGVTIITDSQQQTEVWLAIQHKSTNQWEHSSCADRRCKGFCYDWAR